MKPENHKKLNRLGKKIAPIISKVVKTTHLNGPISMVSWYLNFIQGKGAGAGWELSAEAKVSLSVLGKRKDLVLFDLGANVGDWSDCMVRELGDSCTIYQFEPTKECIKILKDKTKTNVILVPYAVGNKVGVEEIYSIAGVQAKSASLYKRSDTCFADRQYRKEKVKITTLDEFIKEKNIETVDFVKMDIEGHELYALKGAINALKNGIILALSFEFGISNVNSRTFFRDFWELLVPFGYKIYRICPGGVVICVNEYYEDLEYFRGATNYFAVKTNVNT